MGPAQNSVVLNPQRAAIKVLRDKYPLGDDVAHQYAFSCKISGRYMYTHAPSEYLCPYCLFVQGKANEQIPLKQTDIVFQTADLTAFIATRKWVNNQGHVLIIPNEHFENIFDLPSTLSEQFHTLTRNVALAMKAKYQCDGITIRQHNEPAGDQHIWHYHLHVIPRYEDDNFHNSQRVPFEASERAKYAQKLKTWFEHDQDP